MISNIFMKDSELLGRVLKNMDDFGAKLDKNTDKLYHEIGVCKTDIHKCSTEVKLVQKDLTNHLDNKKSESEGFNRRMKIGMGLIGITFSLYAAVKELL